MNESILHVGNLPYSIGRDDLEAMFLNCGTVVSASLMTYKFDSRSRGFGGLRFIRLAIGTDLSKDHYHAVCCAPGSNLQHDRAARTCRCPYLARSSLGNSNNIGKALPGLNQATPYDKIKNQS